MVLDASAGNISMRTCVNCDHRNPDSVSVCERCGQIITLQPAQGRGPGAGTIPDIQVPSEMALGLLAGSEVQESLSVGDMLFEEPAAPINPIIPPKKRENLGFSLADQSFHGADPVQLAQRWEAENLKDPLLHQEVGNFRFVEKIGKGGFGAVYKAEQIFVGEPVAIKVLHLHQVDNPEVVRRFQREARALAQLRHPGIVRMIDFGMLPQYGFYLVMEFLKGHNVFDCLRVGELFPVERLSPIFGQLCEVLAFVHRKGIVHRDLKLSNIYLTPRPDGSEKVTLLDFGIAAIADDIDSITKTGAYIGTATYASPEQAQGVRELDGRSDLYSLAVLLFRLLAGVPPFQGNNSMDITHQKLARPAPMLRDIAPHRIWAESLEELMRVTLSLEPEQRPGDAHAFWALCEEAFAEQAELDEDGTLHSRGGGFLQIGDLESELSLSDGASHVSAPSSPSASDLEAPEDAKSASDSQLVPAIRLDEGSEEGLRPTPGHTLDYAGSAPEGAELQIGFGPHLGSTQEWAGPESVIQAIEEIEKKQREQQASQEELPAAGVEPKANPRTDPLFQEEGGEVSKDTKPESLLKVSKGGQIATQTLDEMDSFLTIKQEGLSADASLGTTQESKLHINQLDASAKTAMDTPAISAEQIEAMSLALPSGSKGELSAADRDELDSGATFVMTGSPELSIEDRDELDSGATLINRGDQLDSGPTVVNPEEVEKLHTMVKGAIESSASSSASLDALDSDPTFMSSDLSSKIAESSGGLSALHPQDLEGGITLAEGAAARHYHNAEEPSPTTEAPSQGELPAAPEVKPKPKPKPLGRDTAIMHPDEMDFALPPTERTIDDQGNKSTEHPTQSPTAKRWMMPAILIVGATALALLIYLLTQQI